MNKDTLRELSVKELKVIAKKNGLKRYSRLKKTELISLIERRLFNKEKKSSFSRFWSYINDTPFLVEFLSALTVGILLIIINTIFFENENTIVPEGREIVVKGNIHCNENDIQKAILGIAYDLDEREIEINGASLGACIYPTNEDGYLIETNEEGEFYFKFTADKKDTISRFLLIVHISDLLSEPRGFMKRVQIFNSKDGYLTPQIFVNFNICNENEIVGRWSKGKATNDEAGKDIFPQVPIMLCDYNHDYDYIHDGLNRINFFNLPILDDDFFQTYYPGSDEVITSMRLNVFLPKQAEIIHPLYKKSWKGLKLYSDVLDEPIEEVWNPVQVNKFVNNIYVYQDVINTLHIDISDKNLRKESEMVIKDIQNSMNSTFQKHYQNGGESGVFELNFEESLILKVDSISYRFSKIKFLF